MFGKTSVGLGVRTEAPHAPRVVYGGYGEPVSPPYWNIFLHFWSQNEYFGAFIGPSDKHTIDENF